MDPAGPCGGVDSDPSSMNRYTYVGCDPVNFVDPDGNKRRPFSKCVAGAAAAGLVTGSFAAAFATPTGPGAAVAGLSTGLGTFLAGSAACAVTNFL